MLEEEKKRRMRIWGGVLAALAQEREREKRGEREHPVLYIVEGEKKDRNKVF